MTPVSDPRIGQLMRSGTMIHYAFLGNEMREGNPDLLLDWLEGRSTASGERTTQAAKKPLVSYVVRVSVKHPAWNDRPFDKVVDARTARDAERDVRDWMFREGLHSRRDGALIVKARRA